MSSYTGESNGTVVSGIAPNATTSFRYRICSVCSVNWVLTRVEEKCSELIAVCDKCNETNSLSITCVESDNVTLRELKNDLSVKVNEADSELSDELDVFDGLLLQAECLNDNLMLITNNIQDISASLSTDEHSCVDQTSSVNYDVKCTSDIITSDILRRDFNDLNQLDIDDKPPFRDINDNLISTTDPFQLKIIRTESMAVNYNDYEPVSVKPCDDADDDSFTERICNNNNLMNGSVAMENCVDIEREMAPLTIMTVGVSNVDQHFKMSGCLPKTNVCDICGQQFAVKRELIEHEQLRRTDSSEKPYVCALCDKQCIDTISLTSRINPAHENCNKITAEPIPLASIARIIQRVSLMEKDLVQQAMSVSKHVVPHTISVHPPVSQQTVSAPEAVSQQTVFVAQAVSQQTVSASQAVSQQTASATQAVSQQIGSAHSVVSLQTIADRYPIVYPLLAVGQQTFISHQDKIEDIKKNLDNEPVMEDNPSNDHLSQTDSEVQLADISLTPDLILSRIDDSRTTAKPCCHQCRVCPKIFKHVAALARHERTHTDRLPYARRLRNRKQILLADACSDGDDSDWEESVSCKHCDKEFESSFSLARHVRQKHSVSKLVTCSKCFQNFQDTLKHTCSKDYDLQFSGNNVPAFEYLAQQSHAIIPRSGALHTASIAVGQPNISHIPIPQNIMFSQPVKQLTVSEHFPASTHDVRTLNTWTNNTTQAVAQQFFRAPLAMSSFFRFLPQTVTHVAQQHVSTHQAVVCPLIVLPEQSVAPYNYPLIVWSSDAVAQNTNFASHFVSHPSVALSCGGTPQAETTQRASVLEAAVVQQAVSASQVVSQQNSSAPQGLSQEPYSLQETASLTTSTPLAVVDEHLQASKPGLLKHPCSLCRQRFASREEMLEHERLHRPDPNEKCGICGAIFDSEIFLRDHYRYKHLAEGGRAIQCSFCPSTLKSARSFVSHIRLHTGEKPYACTQCDDQFINERRLACHVNSRHQAETCNKCPQCGMIFNELKAFKIHTQMHNAELPRPYACTQCDKTYTCSKSLNSHIRFIHDKKFNCVCAECGKGCVNKSMLKTHISIRHGGERLHLCTMCGKKFATKRHLETHAVSHTGEKPYACTKCDMRFSSTSTRSLHYQRVHTDERPFVCAQCGKTFKLKQQFKRHMWGHTGERPHACKQCNKRFSIAACLDRHVKEKHIGEERYKCIHCDMMLTQKQSLTRHVKLLHSNECPYVCAQCKRRFSDGTLLKMHLLTH